MEANTKRCAGFHPHSASFFHAKLLSLTFTAATMNISFPNYHDAQPATDFDRQPHAFVQEWFSETETVQVQTSGSTGTPKILEIEKDRMRHSARMTCRFLNLQAGDSALLCLPVAYISGKMMVVRAIEQQLKLMVSEPSVRPLEHLAQTVDFCALTPLQVEHSLDKLHLIRNIIIGGAAVSAALKVKIQDVLEGQEKKVKIYETYGMSETLSHIALKEIFPKAAPDFTVLSGVQISLDPRGCLQILAPQLSAELIVTNDLVELTGTNSFIFQGRYDNVINSGGLKIFPEQLETLVHTVTDRELAFLGLPDEQLGQKLVLAIEGGESTVLTDDIRHLTFPTRNHLPKEIIFIPEFPRTPNGKVSRLELLNILKSNERFHQ